jgi:hypothetical protein
VARDPHLGRHHGGHGALLEPRGAAESRGSGEPDRAAAGALHLREHDQPNVIELTPAYYAAAGEPKALWEVPGASHTGGIEARPKEYERRVVAFFDDALLDQ